RLPLIADPPADAVPIGEVALRPPGQAAAASGPVFGDQLRLVEARAPASAHPGDTLDARLLWRAERVPDRDYTIFVHLQDARGRLVAQHDGEPDGGRYPTSLWAPGEGVADSHAVVLPPDLAPGRYTLLIGVYDRETGGRLALPDADTFVASSVDVQ